MPDNVPSIEDLINKKQKKDNDYGKGYKVSTTLKNVNRSFEERQIATKAQELGYEYINLKGFPVDVEALALISEKEAEESGVISFHHEGGEVRLGSVDPTSSEVEKIRRKLEKQKYKVRVFMISPDSLQDGLLHYKRVVEKKEKEDDSIKLSEKDVKEKAEKFKNITSKNFDPQKVSASELLAQIISLSLVMEASDIHLEPEEEAVQLRMRVDGVLQDITNISKEALDKLISRIKILSHLKLNVTTTPQDGSFSIKLGKDEVDFRVSTIPSVYGESLVIRVLEQDLSLTLDDLGMRGLTRKRIDGALKSTNGMILTTGPTGSGKTTTLYTMLQVLNKPGVKIITVEDPVEYKVEGLSQTPIDKRAGMTFASGLKAILRQDPDVVMVGEIREHEAAEVAIQASLTGHVVLSTLHTNDAISIIPRLLDLNIKPFLITGSIKLAMAQRLVRRLCEGCKEEDKLDEKILKRVKTQLKAIPKSTDVEVPDELKFYSSSGCKECNDLGYKGRVGIFESFVITDGLEKLILRQAPLSALRQQVIEDGMITMAQNGLLKALDGVTDVYEVFRVTD